ncbi:MAG: WD40 repeat domain-containing protein [Planctomycetota bacterium]|jgi:WD40 repeat protein
MGAKKRKLIVFPGVIVLVFLAAVFLSKSKSNLVQELRGPKAGARAVFTSADKLLVRSGANEVYTWDWNDLNKWPTVARLNTALLCPMAADKIIYVPNDKPDAIVVTGLKDEKEIKKISLPYGATCKMIAPSADCSFIAALLVRGNENTLAMVGPELELTEVYSVSDEDMNVLKIGISNDGQLIAAAGENNGGRALVVDTRTKKVVFENKVEEIEKLDNVIFSPSSEVVYFGEKVRFIYAFESATGNLLRTFEIPEYPPVPQKKQIISAIDISPDGLLLAASTEPVQRLYIWNAQTGQKNAEFGLPGPVVGDIAFSPNSDRVATSVVVRSTISIWKATGAE